MRRIVMTIGLLVLLAIPASGFACYCDFRSNPGSFGPPKVIVPA